MKAKKISAVLFLSLIPALAWAQDNFGAGFMKLAVGARQIAMGRTFAGLGDDIYTMTWNPGAMGFLRRWQAAVGYDQWVTDAYQASAFYAQKIHFCPVEFTVGGGVTYFGMPSFDSTQGAEAPQSANSYIAMLASGMRLNWLPWFFGDMGKHISVGSSAKFVKSNLAQTSATGVAADVGFTIRPPRIPLGSNVGSGIFDYAILTFGATWQNVNSGKLTYDTVPTRMPKQTKYGGALRLGRHDGWSVLFAFDSGKYVGEERVNHIGTEVWWRQLLGIRTGYVMNDADIGGFTVGAGIKLGATVFSSAVPFKRNELRLDYANADNGPFFKQTYRGSMSLYPNDPDKFCMVFPPNLKGFENAYVGFRWTAAEDPDPYDDIERYVLLVDGNLETLEKARASLRANPRQFLSSDWRNRLDFYAEVEGDTLEATLPGSEVDFYWSVAALDRSNHVRFAHGSDEVRRFSIQRPDLVVEAINLDHHEFITPKTDGLQGIMEVVVKNVGNGSARKKSKLVLRGLHKDELSVSADSLDVLLAENDREFRRGETRFSEEIEIDGLAPGQTMIVRFDPTNGKKEWRTTAGGAYRFFAQVDANNKVEGERYEDNNSRVADIYTIPKWNGAEIYIPAKDSFNVVVKRYTSIEIPVIPIVFFDENSSRVGKEYLQSEVPTGVLQIMAERLREKRSARIALRGFVDPQSDQPSGVQLAMERALAVKTALISLNVNENQIRIDRPVNPARRRIQRSRASIADLQDAARINEENRRVELSVHAEGRIREALETELFRPDTMRVDPVVVERERGSDLPALQANVTVPAGVEAWDFKIELQKAHLKYLTDQSLAQKDSVKGVLHWNCTDDDRVTVNPLDQKFVCRVDVKDRRNRTFRTLDREFTVHESETILKEHIFALFDYDTVSTTYGFYRDRLNAFADTLASLDERFRIAFIGHTDAIGPEDHNQRLSESRANELHREFLRIISSRAKTEPDRFNYRLFQRVDDPSGEGEREPLGFKTLTYGRLLVGNNSHPVGRNRNRRVMVHIYRSEVPRQQFTTK